MAEAANPYQTPRAAVNETPGETQPVKLFSASGRIGRVRYIAYAASSYIVIWIAIMVLAMILGSQLAWLAFVVGWAAMLVIGFMLTIQRCHDFNMSGWLSLVVLVPFANLIFWFIPGTAGANRWGAPTPPNSAWAIAGACLPAIGVPVIGILAAVAIPAYQDYTYRAKISEVIMTGSQWRTAVSEHYMQTRKMPSSSGELRKDSVPTGESRYGVVSLGPEGVVTMTLSAQMGPLAEKTILLRPQMAGGQIADWDCTGGTLQARYRPARCRPQ
jgi:uncharacterized membrane protein YhaH (DUF805 family)